jgi:hypothetical protein
MITDHADLYDGERVLWTGHPARFPVFDFVGILITAVGIYCVVGAYFTIVSGLRHGNTAQVILASLIALCALAVIIGRPILRRATLRTTRYLLTESRIIIGSTIEGRRATIVHLRDLTEPTLSIRDGASIGTIRFESSTVMLIEVEHARHVHHLLTSMGGRHLRNDPPIGGTTGTAGPS